MSAKTVKISANLSEEVVNALRDIAAKKNVSLTEALRQAISTELFLVDAQRRNAKVLIEEPDKTMKQLIML